MTSAARLCARAILVLGLLPAALSAAEKPDPARDKTLALGRELFVREWVPGDPRSHGGDGLGPVYNERSCLACHHQGGPGGSAPADRNIDIITATGDGLPADGFFYAFGMSLGSAGFQYKFTSNAGAPRLDRPKPAELAAVHPGFRDGGSVLLHRFGPDFAYRSWRETVPGTHGSVQVRLSQRNPSPLFGAGLIDAIPDDVIEAAAKRRVPGQSAVKGRVSRLANGRIGRFGWKAQTATLRDFIRSAAASELGLEVPGAHQGADPRIPPLAAPGLDMTEEECEALAAYVRGLPAPVQSTPAGPKAELYVKAGGTLFKSIGCAQCHLPKLGDVEGIYSDLLLHDMSPRLSDTGFYGVFASRAAEEAARTPAPRQAAGRKAEVGARVQEWRTPPLWGLRDSAPYLHDGRADTIEQAITLHGGQGEAAARRYAQLSAREHQQLETFLLSLAAPRAAKAPGP
jgi:CxxC motif-containing protein (DUF1111 family)